MEPWQSLSPQEIESCSAGAAVEAERLLTPVTVGHAVYDLSTRRLVSVNLNFCDITGYPEADLLEMGLAGLIRPEDWKSHEQRFALAVQNDASTFADHLRCIRKDGEMRWVRAEMAILRDAAGQPRTAAVFLIDQTRHKQLKDRLSESPNLQRAILDSLQQHIAVLDRHGRIIALNSSWNRFGQENGQTEFGSVGAGCNYLAILRKAVQENVPDAEAALQGILGVLTGEAERFEMEYECSSPTEERWYLQTVVPFEGESGGVVVAHTDISERRKFERLVADLSARFVNVIGDQLDFEISSALDKVLEFFAVDSCGFFRVKGDHIEADRLHMATRTGAVPLPNQLELSKCLPWATRSAIRNGRPFSLNHHRNLPTQANIDKCTLKAWNVLSLQLIPILMEGDVRYLLSIAATEYSRRWPREHIPRLQILGETFANALSRKAMQDSLENQLQFERLLSVLSGRFVNIAPEDVESEIEVSLQQLLDFFQVDWCCLIEMNPGQDATEVPYYARAADIETEPAPVELHALLPWVYGQIVDEGRVVAVETPQQLPPDAKVDRETFQKWGMQSLVIVPVPTGSTDNYAIAMSTARSARVWPGGYHDRLRVLGTTFVDALIRRNIAIALRRSEKRLAEAQNIAQLAALDWDVVTAELVWSFGLDQLLGLPAQPEGRDRAPDTTFQELLAAVHINHRARVEHAFYSLGKTGEPAEVEFVIVRQDGAERSVRLRGQLGRTSGRDSAVRVAATIQDITEAKSAERDAQLLRSQLWHADRVARMGTISASLAHELNQPLTSILSNAQAGQMFLDREPPDLNEIKSIFSDIVDDDKRAGSVIRGLRSMLRKQPVQEALVNLPDVAAEVTELVRTELVSRHIELHRECVHDAFVMADRTQMQQVILNLIMNAAEAMDAIPIQQRRLELCIRKLETGEVRFSLRDHGPGISPEVLDQIFEPFWSTKPKGMGIGLAVCRSIIEAHRGQIWAENHEEQGLIFYVQMLAEHVTRGCDANATSSATRT